ncbi:AMP-binding protein [Alicyclobacillus fastidiosus]|uniref:AMP-binding protein n=1 Tax=Alicyclobacillus fastidiosus TaxID=392011 RepID=A0ABY6ZIU1_9BACL|nr:AMP-binding protein [Alicyclobacillus fastidiosus]WAH42777.1 AMP-binding protein [Alicyclobacillus fastidiosus]
MDLTHAPLFIDKIDETIRSHPDRIAIVDLSTDEPITLTYARLDRLANRVASKLVELGVEPGDAVAYQLPSSWEFIALTLGLWRISATPCPLLPSLREREVKFIMQSSGSKLLIVPDEFRKFSYRQLVDAIRDELPVLEHVFVLPQSVRRPEVSDMGGLLTGETIDLTSRRPGPNTYSELLYTSGTTGEPKGVLHTHQTLSSALLAHTTTLSLTADDRIWAPSPLAHQTGFLYGMLVSFYLGATGIYQAIWNVDTARAAIEEHGATFVQAAMPFLADLTRSEVPPKGLRIFVATGAAVPRQLAREARAALACNVTGGWGSTEACLVCVGRPSDPAEKLAGTDGRVIDGMAIRIVDDEGNVVPPGVEGSYQVKTPAMFATYLHHHEWYEESHAGDGFFDTGDLALIDEDGFLKLTGRKKDVVNRGGEKIPVVEIEDLLYQHEAIADVAVVAMPDPRLGERACAYIVVNDGHEAPELSQITDFLGDRGMAKIYWPERVEVIDEMPRTASGKIQKYVLRNDITEKLNAEQKA